MIHIHSRVKFALCNNHYKNFSASRKKKAMVNLPYKTNKNSRKNRLLFLYALLLLIIFLFLSTYNAVAESNLEEIEHNLYTNVFEQLGNIKFDELEDVLNQSENVGLFGGSFKEKVESLLNGEYFSDFSSIFSALFFLIFSSLKSLFPILLLIFAIVLLLQILVAFKSKNYSEGVEDIVHFVAYSLIIVLVVSLFTGIITKSTNTLNLLKVQMDLVFPILLTLLTAVGGLISVGIYQPVVAILSNGISTILNTFLYPIFTISFVLIIISNITTKIRLNKLVEFLASTFKWSVGFVFTIFTAILSMQGVSAGRHDGVSLTATRFAVKSYVPLIGGYLSDGLDFILLSSVLLKNAVGVGALLLIFATVLSPVIYIVITKLALQLLSAMLEVVGDDRVCSFINGVSKILIYPVVIILAIAFMYFIFIGLVISTGNIL